MAPSFGGQLVALCRGHPVRRDPLARRLSEAQVSIAVTGVAGPGSDSDAKPAGLVHLACARSGAGAIHERHAFGDIGRDAVRRATVEAALDLVLRRIEED